MSDQIDFSEAEVFHRTTVVRARRLAAPHEWTTGRGDRLSAEEGDWLLSSDDSEWTVADDVFRSTYEQNPDGTWTKTTPIRAVRVSAPTVVHTLEGDAVAAPGDWVAENPSGERWPITHRYLMSNYSRS